MSVLTNFLIVPDKMDDEDRRLLPVCQATIQIIRRDHDGDSCCGINAAVSVTDTETETEEWWVSVPRALREEISTNADGDSIFAVRSELISPDGLLLHTEETAELFASWNTTIGSRCWEKGRCGQCAVSDTHEVLQIRVIPRP